MQAFFVWGHVEGARPPSAPQLGSYVKARAHTWPPFQFPVLRRDFLVGAESRPLKGDIEGHDDRLHCARL